MSWLFFSLLSVFCWGVGQAILKKGFRNLTSLQSVIISTCINLFVYVPFAIIAGASFSIPLPYLFVIFIISFLYIFFFYAIEKGQLSLTGTIFATYPVTTIILSTIFLGERLSTPQLLMIGSIIAGGMLLASSDKKTKGKIKSSWLAWAILASVTTGAGDFLAKVTLNAVPLQTYNFYYPFMYALALLPFLLIDKKGRKIAKGTQSKHLLWTIGGVVLLTFGLLSLNYAFSLYKVSIVTTIASSYTALTILIAYFFLHEKITRRQLIALIMIIIGVMFIGIA